ncbi:hypothetical protein PVL29_024319 [Vitis rotundifolia]|uniref:laccase n=1 Tax=Vitis rotundifolia TaxID=103349 RepID=A0AA38YRG8_VITRO|nr:hypothetical protein PVL29_024319 [Vitis rotundifolia]
MHEHVANSFPIFSLPPSSLYIRVTIHFLFAPSTYSVLHIHRFPILHHSYPHLSYPLLGADPTQTLSYPPNPLLLLPPPFIPPPNPLLSLPPPLIPPFAPHKLLSHSLLVLTGNKPYLNPIHAWSRATVHGPLIIRPEPGKDYPFPQPQNEVPIVLDVMEIIETALQNGGEPNQSDAFTINGQPGDLYDCSTEGTFKMVHMNKEMFFMVANHSLTVVGTDGAYIKPINTSYIMITPGQTMDVLIKADQSPSYYYMASRAYAVAGAYDNTTTTAIVHYNGNYTPPSTTPLPNLPNYTDTDAAANFTVRLRSLANEAYPIDVPQTVDTHMYITISMNTLPCVNNSCDGPDGSRLASSLNNISFVEPPIDVLLAYYKGINGVYDTDFPNEPPYYFNFTGDDLPDTLLTPERGTKVKVLDYNSNVEIVFQGTNVMNAAENHPMHLHGYNFYVVGNGTWNFDNSADPTRYNLVDPPEVNTVGVPKNGWVAIRFRADNPGVWFMHCHLERHASWGLDTVLIVKNGTT